MVVSPSTNYSNYIEELYNFFLLQLLEYYSFENFINYKQEKCNDLVVITEVLIKRKLRHLFSSMNFFVEGTNSVLSVQSFMDSAGVLLRDYQKPIEN